jgi:thiol-disulfide isomerase/thioredoxin
MLLLLTTTATLKLFGQQVGLKTHELKIGDTIPPVILSGLLKESGKSVNISSLYQKGLLIIDFGATWCVPCIRELSVLDTLSKKYSNALSVLSVDYENKETISSFFLKHNEIDISLFAVITDDTLFLRFFPHKSLPHNVWVDKHGVIRAITGSNEINKKNINAFINGSNYNLLTKHDDMNFDHFKPYHLTDTTFTYRSVFSGYNPEINSGTLNDRNVNPMNFMKRAFAWNCTVTDLFWLAAFPQVRYASQFPFYPRIEFHTKDSIRFILEKHKEIMKVDERNWSLKNLFCYELILPKPVPDTVFSEYMLADLERNFNVIAKIEKREQPCVILSRKKGVPPYPRSKQAQSAFNIEGHDISVKKMTIDDFLYKLFCTWDTIPIINESQIDYPVDFYIPFDKGIKLIEVFSYLKSCGFEIKEEVRPLNKLILYDMDK